MSRSSSFLRRGPSAAGLFRTVALGALAALGACTGPGADVDAGPDDDGDAGAVADGGALLPPDPDDVLVPVVLDAGPLPDPATGFWSGAFTLPGANGDGARVSALATSPDGATIYVGGTFTSIGGVDASSVASFDGASFAALGAGLDVHVEAFAVDDDGVVYAVGPNRDFAPPHHVWKWDGAEWSALPGDLDGAPHAVRILSDGTLLVGGEFADANGAAGIARHDGAGFVAWNGAVTSWDGQAPGGIVSVIHEDPTFGVCIGGMFGFVGATEASNVACFDDGAWSQLGDGMPGEVLAMVRDGADRLVVGGGFAFFDDADPDASPLGIAVLDEAQDTFEPHAGGVHLSSLTEVRALLPLPGGDRLLVLGNHGGGGDVFAPHAAFLDDGTTWSALDAQPIVGGIGAFLPGNEGVYAALRRPDGSLLLGGFFDEAGGQVAANIVRWTAADGFATILPAGKSFFGINGFVDDIAAFGVGDVVVGGSFSWAGTTPAANVARFRNGGYEAVGPGLDGIVRELLVVDGADGRTVYAGGEFSGPVGAPQSALFLARFDVDDDDPTWRRLSVGEPDGPVTALAVDADGALIVGGDFTSIGGTTALRVARIVGDVVQPLGAGFDQRVTSVTVDPQGRVVAGGLFHASGSTVVHGVAVFDGGAWLPLGGGLSPDDYASTVAVHDGELLVGGRVSLSADTANPTVGLLRYTGDGWEPYAGGLKGDMGFSLVSRVASYDGKLFVVGIFDLAGDVRAQHVAWRDDAGWHALGGGLGDVGEDVHVDPSGVLVGGAFAQVDGKGAVGLARWVIED